jgi:nucleotide-binding universal stress UspA family protein
MYQRILCATDGTEHGDRALSEGLRLAREAGGELHVVHVIERIPGGGRLRGQNVFVTEPAIDDRIREQVDDIACELGIAVHMHTLSGSGQLARRLADLGERLDVDLIVLGSRGHSPLRGIVLGSVTQQMLHDAGRPVLAVPPERAGERVAEPARATAAAA